MFLKTIPLLAVLIAGSHAAPCLSESMGALTLNLAGEDHVVPVWSEQSDWSGGEDWPSINIYARAFSENGRDPLVVSLSFEAARWDPSVPELELSRYEGGALAFRLHAREEQERGALSVTLDDHAVNGTMLSLTGSFEGTLGTSENHGRDIDLSDGVPITGTFEVTLETLD